STLLVIVCALLSGCATDLKVAKFEPSSSTGIAYNLPFTQFSIASKWTITSGSPAMEITVKVDATAGTAEDGDHSYVIAPASIQTATNVASLKVTYQNGTNVIDTINADAEDQTGAVITNIATGVAKIALAVLSGAPSPHTPFAPPPCSRTTVTALNTVKELTAKLKTLNDRVTAQTKVVKTLGAKAAQMGAAVDATTKKSLGQAIDALNGLTVQQTDLSDQLADAQKSVTYSETDYWPKDSRTFFAKPGMQLPPS